MSRAVPRKSVLWVRHRIRRIRNRTSDEEVFKKRKLRNQRENEKKEEIKMMKRVNRENEGCACFIKVANIHFNPSSKIAFKSNSFSYNSVQNCNLVRKLIPN